jgi:hypothetical protein
MLLADRPLPSQPAEMSCYSANEEITLFCGDYLVADAVRPNRSAARRFTWTREINERLGQNGLKGARAEAGNEDLQSVSTDAKREESRKPREANVS